VVLSPARIVRIAATALITAGVVVLVEAGVTLAWQEPLSSLAATIAQGQASDELEKLESSSNGLAERARRLEDRRGLDAAAAARLAERFRLRLREGHAIGRLKIPSIDQDSVMIEGTSTDDLRKGPGHYPETSLPGQRGTVAVAGHRTTYLAPFHDIDELGKGDRAMIEMPYGLFTYEFEKRRIVNPSQTGVVRPVGHDRLVLTACHPLYSASQRIVVFMRLLAIRAP
jgi:sortase A